LAQSEYFHSGVLIDPLVASLAFPMLIKPQLIGGSHYVDGGLMNNLPVQPLIGNCSRIIGVYVNPVYRVEKGYGTKNYMDRIIHLGLRANMSHLIAQCDLFIEPPELSKYSLLKISATKEIFEQGYDFTLKLLKSHSDLKPFQSG
jgi:NTE family protein